MAQAAERSDSSGGRQFEPSFASGQRPSAAPRCSCHSTTMENEVARYPDKFKRSSSRSNVGMHSHSRVLQSRVRAATASAWRFPPGMRKTRREITRLQFPNWMNQWYCYCVYVSYIRHTAAETSFVSAIHHRCIVHHSGYLPSLRRAKYDHKPYRRLQMHLISSTTS